MGCLSFKITTVPQAVMKVVPQEQAKLKITGYPSGVPHLTASLNVKPTTSAKLKVTTMQQAKLNLAPEPQAKLQLMEVCGISDGEIYALAVEAGALRTQDGGYLSLDPQYQS